MARWRQRSYVRNADARRSPHRCALSARERRADCARDRSHIIREDVAVTLPAGSFTGCLKVFDTDGLDPQAPPENKIYCPGIGNVVDETLVLTQYGHT